MDWNLLFEVLGTLGTLAAILLIYIGEKKNWNTQKILGAAELADRLINWVEAEFPELPYVEQIDKAIDAFIEEMRKAGAPVDDITASRQVIGSFAKRNREESLLTSAMYYDDAESYDTPS